MSLSRLLLFLALCFVGDSKIYRSIIWSPDNPIFKESRLRCVLPKSMQYILCPSLALIVTDRDKQLVKESLFENIWFVDQQSYDSCKVNSGGQLLKKCDTPLVSSRYDILFIDMHPLSGGLEFKFGKTYYIMATSNGTQNSLSNKEGGHCKTNSMKLQFYVCKDNNDPYCQSEENCQHLLDKPTENSPIEREPHTTIPVVTSPVCNTTKRIPTTSNETVPPDSGHYCGSVEVFYKLGISLLLLICVVFILTTIFLSIRYYRFSKIHSDCSKKYSVQLSPTSNGSTNVDNDSSGLLSTIKETNKTV